MLPPPPENQRSPFAPPPPGNHHDHPAVPFASMYSGSIRLRYCAVSKGKEAPAPPPPPPPRRSLPSVETMRLDRQKRLDRRNRLRHNRIPFKPPPPLGGGVVDEAAAAAAARSSLEEEEEEDHGIPVLQKDLGSLDLSSSSLTPPPPKFRFPWAAADTGSAIKILSVDEIASKLGITDIAGEFVCSKCHLKGIIGFNLKTKSKEFAMNISGGNLGDWILRPKLPPCPNCSCNLTLEPVIPTENDRINWLFLFLGQMLGCCTVEQLDFFCKHSSSSTSEYRTGGAKDRLLYLTYITLCKQLYPTGPFDL